MTEEMKRIHELEAQLKGASRVIDTLRRRVEETRERERILKAQLQQTLQDHRYPDLHVA